MPDKPIRQVFLAVPPTGLYIREDRCQTPIDHMATVALRPPIDLLYAAAAFRQGGAECILADYPAEGRDIEAMIADLRQAPPDLLMLSITTPGFEDDMAAAARIKQALPEVIVAAKGAHFNTLDRHALQRHAALDLVFRGEFEPACRELAEGRPWREIPGLTFRDPGAPDGILRTADRPFIQNLDELPFPARDLCRNELYIRPDTGEMQTTIVTNRGCPFSCCYCLANQVAGKRNRVRSTENILDEIEECVKDLGIRNFLFRSDLFTADRKWVRNLCEGIGRRNLDIAWSCNSRVDTLDTETLKAMRRAGCWIIAFGIESGSQKMLDYIGKKTDLETARRALKMTRKAGILSSVYFMMGFPDESAETLAANDRFARELDPDILEIFYVYPFPGTKIYAEAVELGLLKEGQIPHSAYDAPAMPTRNMTGEQLAEARNRALRRFYLRPQVIWRTLRRARSLSEFANYVRYGLRQLKDFL